MTSTPSSEQALDLAAETLYRFFAAALSDPRRPQAELLFDHFSQHVACEAADLLREHFGDVSSALGFGELPAAELDLRPLLDQLDEQANGLGDEYIRVFGFSTCRECPPYETEYHKAEEVFFRSQQMADIAGFYQAFGLTPGGAARERPDYLVLELEFAAYLLMKKRLASVETTHRRAAVDCASICQAARTSFFRDHVSWWVPSFTLALRRKAEQGFYAQVGRALAAFLPIERRRLEVSPPRLPLKDDIAELPSQCDGCLLNAD